MGTPASFDPWVLQTFDPFSNSGIRCKRWCRAYNRNGAALTSIKAGNYVGGALVQSGSDKVTPATGAGYKQTLDLRTGTLTTVADGKTVSTAQSSIDWPGIWKSTDIYGLYLCGRDFSLDLAADHVAAVGC